MANDTMIQLAVNAIRTRSIDAVQGATSGHPDPVVAAAKELCAEAGRA